MSEEQRLIRDATLGRQAKLLIVTFKDGIYYVVKKLTEVLILKNIKMKYRNMACDIIDK